MDRFTARHAFRNGIPTTGQTTVYQTGDNGTNQAGVAHRYEVKNTGQYSGTVAITLNGKTDTKSNAVVIDHAFRVMWSQTVSASVGPTSNGLLPWTTNANGEGVATYVAAANVAGVGGHTDWRSPTDIELMAIRDMEQPSAIPDTTYFPSFWGVLFVQSSTTRPNGTTNNLIAGGAAGTDAVQIKTSTALVVLIRSI